jgi:hypothetical protein
LHGLVGGFYQILLVTILAQRHCKQPLHYLLVSALDTRK